MPSLKQHTILPRLEFPLLQYIRLKKTKILKKPVHVHKNSGMNIKTQEIKLKQC